jgi:hypothetical protein
MGGGAGGKNQGQRDCRAKALDAQRDSQLSFLGHNSSFRYLNANAYQMNYIFKKAPFAKKSGVRGQNPLELARNSIRIKGLYFFD